MLPMPTRERWQPLRLGLVDLFYYDREQFVFHDGRLLLRGNNGTGKSKVLALTLPFLLDGELSAHRVEPDADPNKRMEWNLLLGGEHPNDERLGYTWLELGRRDGGTPVFCTIGCGLKAVKGRGISSHWFFVTDQRVGDELELVDATGVALTAERLEEALGAHGTLHRRAREHRHAVDERLFGLGEVRYSALVDLLLRIRAPQLSKRPDERGLSAALTGALPPLDQALLNDVAEAFRALEEDGEQLAAMVEARDAAKRYLATYSAYARMATRRRAAPLRQAQTEFDRVSRELARAEEQHTAARAELTAAGDALQQLRVEQTQLEARRQALADDPAARSARELQSAVEQAEEAERWRAETDSGLGRLAERLTQLQTRLHEAEAELEAAETALAQARADALACAQQAAIGAELEDVLAGSDPAELRARTQTLLTRQTKAVEHVHALIRACEQAQATLVQARQQTEQLASDHAQCSTRCEDATVRVREAAASYLRQARAGIGAAHELELPDPEATFAALEAWLETLSGENPFALASASAGREAARQIERAQVLAGQRAGEQQATIDELEQEIETLAAGVHPLPPVPYTRGADVRTQRAGAPLWQLIDFREQTEPAQRAGLEAALEAAGILDAWVTPNGELLDAGTEDVILSAAGAAPAGPCLADVITPAIDDHAGAEATRVAHPAVERAVVERLLHAIGLEQSDSAVWVSVNGRFRNGVVHGAWHKPSATFIGHAAREQARRARLGELRERAEQARAALSEIEVQRAQLARRQELLERELEALPSEHAVREAQAALSATQAELAALTARLAQAREREQAALSAVEAAARALAADAQDLRLPQAADQLAEVSSALGLLRERLAGLWPAFLRLEHAQRAHLGAASDVQAANSEQQELSTRLEEAERRLAGARERRDTLKATAGAAIEELQRRQSEVQHAQIANTAAQRQTETRLGAAQRADGAAEALRTELGQQLEVAIETRVRAAGSLRRFAGTGLIAVALPELELPDPGEEWNVTQALRLARAIEQELSADADEESRWQRLQRQVTDELGVLSDALRRHGNNAAASFQEDGIVIEVTFRGHATTLPDLQAALEREVEERQRLLDSREREILENHLVGEIASTLQELIAAAERHVVETNLELAQRPTSTGMRLRLRWSPDPEGPEGLADARSRLLRQSSDAWSAADRAAVGAFLQQQIKAVRADDPTGPWLEHLTKALDYRAWHRFSVERFRAGAWHPASGPSSGGERVLAASVPLFAAASSYYSSASNPHAPRLVMLDEAFAGVDDRARAKCLGLLAAFDLDVVMTSEREWGCYAEVPGLAIAQLSRVDGIAAVLVTRWEWDGAVRVRVEDPDEPPPVSAAPRPPGAHGPQLWDTSTAND